MTDYQAARHSMVDSQIHTMGVVNEDVLNAYRTVARERFVPESMRGYAYTDEDFKIGHGLCLMEPVTHARLMQFAAPVPADTVLDIGGATGYSAAILSKLAAKVVALEPETAFAPMAREGWQAEGCTNITPDTTIGSSVCQANAPYNLIFFNGAVAEVPKAYFELLANGGRLVAVIKGRDGKIGRATLFRKNEHGVLSHKILFDAAVPYLKGFEPQPEFTF